MLLYRNKYILKINIFKYLIDLLTHVSLSKNSKIFRIILTLTILHSLRPTEHDLKKSLYETPMLSSGSDWFFLL